jgi:peptidoglycan/xylan/chitin deacetylase (PgdA/CDA1 family)
LPRAVTYWAAPESRRAEAVTRGFLSRHFFAHRVHYVPKCGPDHLKLARWMRGPTTADACWEVILYAEPPALDPFPASLFFDDDLIWHQQQLGQVGQVATANLVLDGSAVYANALVSDLVQRIARRREFKTRVETTFHGWCHVLLNAIAGFARRHGARALFVPTAALAMRHTDRSRMIQPPLYERIYDRAVHARFDAAPDGEWWRVDLPANAHRLLALEPREAPVPETPKTICLVHDTERGFGHEDVEPEFARAAAVSAPAHLEAMLEIERAHGQRATYAVVGCFLDEVRPRIEAGGHAVAFHSYDHGAEDPAAGPEGSQLRRCRRIDYRLKGYRAPRSIITPELADDSLAYYNFEWLASSVSSLATRVPVLAGGIVKIPVAFDDFPLHRRAMTYPEWEARVLRLVDEHDVVALGLHDCYADHWLPRYPGLLDQLARSGALTTLDQLAARVMLASSA